MNVVHIHSCRQTRTHGKQNKEMKSEPSRFSCGLKDHHLSTRFPVPEPVGDIAHPQHNDPNLLLRNAEALGKNLVMESLHPECEKRPGKGCRDGSTGKIAWLLSMKT